MNQLSPATPEDPLDEILDVFSVANNWRGYWCKQILPFVGSSVLEVGAGTGTVTAEMARYAKKHWVALEPDHRRLSRIPEGIFTANGTVIERKVGSLSSMSFDKGQFDTLIYSDVIEHIEDDIAEVSLASELLTSGGYFCVLVPAHQWLFNAFDQEIGHYRRYGKESLSSLFKSDYEKIFVRYLDCVGLLVSLTNRFALQSRMPSKNQIAAWDKSIVPISQILDSMSNFRLGKSILGVWRKR